MIAIRRCFFGSSKGGKHDNHKDNDIPSIPKEGFHLNISTDPLHAPPKSTQTQPKLALEDGDNVEARPDETVVEEARHDENIVVEVRFDETVVDEVPPEKVIVEEPPHDETKVEEAQPDKTVVEEAQPDETDLEDLAPLYKLLLEEPEESKLDQTFRDLIGPYKCLEESRDLSTNIGLHELDNSSLYRCTEILGSESCDNMVKDTSDAVTEWSWSHKHHKKKAIDIDMLVNRGLPPPIPWYVGRPCRFMKVERCNGRITMNEVVMNRQPEMMQIEREVGEIKMQLMTYVEDHAENDDAGDAWNNDAEASTSAFYFRDTWNDDAKASISALYPGNARKNDAEAPTSAMNVGDAGDDDVEATTKAMYVEDAKNDDVEATTEAMYVEDAKNDDVDASASALYVGDAKNDDDVEATTETMHIEDAKNDDIEASASALYVGDARSDDAEASTSGSTSKQVVEACKETTCENEENEEEEDDEDEDKGATDELDSGRKEKKVAAKAA